MIYELPATCPVCHQRFHVKQLGCDNCGSILEGNFQLNRLSKLSMEMQLFIIAFLNCRGNIREMEKALGISYPTVRARLDEIVAALNEQDADGNPGAFAGQEGESINQGASQRVSKSYTRLEILKMLADGDIEIDEAQKLLGGKL